jgi:hypothetical protein
VLHFHGHSALAKPVAHGQSRETRPELNRGVAVYVWQNNAEKDNEKNNESDHGHDDLERHIAVGGLSKRIIIVFKCIQQPAFMLIQQFFLCQSKLLIAQRAVFMEITQPFQFLGYVHKHSPLN